jgi:hypothetical protein
VPSLCRFVEDASQSICIDLISVQNIENDCLLYLATFHIFKLEEMTIYISIPTPKSPPFHPRTYSNPRPAYPFLFPFSFRPSRLQFVPIRPLGNLVHSLAPIFCHTKNACRRSHSTETTLRFLWSRSFMNGRRSLTNQIRKNPSGGIVFVVWGFLFEEMSCSESKGCDKTLG